MLDIGWSELLIVAVVAILVIGPKDLPAALRAFGRWTGSMRRMAGDFQRQFNEAVREAELDDVKKSVTDIGKIDPIADLRGDMKKVEAGLRSELDKQSARAAENGSSGKDKGAASAASVPAADPASSADGAETTAAEVSGPVPPPVVAAEAEAPKS